MNRWQACAGATVALLTQVLLIGGSVAAETPRVLQAVQATNDDRNPARMYSAPTIAVDPDNPQVIVAATAEIRSRTCGLLRSQDRGRTWDPPATSPIREGYPFCFQTETGPPQAVAAFGRDSALYYAYAGWDVQDTLSDWPIGQGGGWRGNVSPIVARSTDLGDSWQTTVVRDARGLKGDRQENNRPVSSLVIDTASGNEDIVYLGWKATYRDRELPVMAVSTDAGKSFSEPVDLTAKYFEDDANRERLAKAAKMEDVPDVGDIKYYWPDLTVDDDGKLYAIWNARFGGGPQMDNTAVFLSTSTDGGQSFSVRELSPATETFRYPALEWSRAGDRQGTLHLVYESETPEKVKWVHDVYYERSTDGGETWSEPKRLSDDPSDALTGQYHPEVAVAPDGRVEVAWWDFRNSDGNFANDVYMTTSQDNGATWSSNLRITDQSVGRRTGVWYGNADIRQAPGMVALDALTLVAWDDTRNGDKASQTQDVFTSLVQYRPIGAGTSSAVLSWLAVACGLGISGVVLLLLAAGSKRASTPRPAPSGSGV
ncbi:MAG: glycoside hydrolase [Actinomycetota bacterium]|nr:glycoside hydrolase [Actinomycetota bacterium]